MRGCDDITPRGGIITARDRSPAAPGGRPAAGRRPRTVAAHRRAAGHGVADRPGAVRDPLRPARGHRAPLPGPPGGRARRRPAQRDVPRGLPPPRRLPARARGGAALADRHRHQPGARRRARRASPLPDAGTGGGRAGRPPRRRPRGPARRRGAARPARRRAGPAWRPATATSCCWSPGATCPTRRSPPSSTCRSGPSAPACTAPAARPASPWRGPDERAHPAPRGRARGVGPHPGGPLRRPRRAAGGDRRRPLPPAAAAARPPDVAAPRRRPGRHRGRPGDGGDRRPGPTPRRRARAPSRWSTSPSRPSR